VVPNAEIYLARFWFTNKLSDDVHHSNVPSSVEEGDTRVGLRSRGLRNETVGCLRRTSPYLSLRRISVEKNSFVFYCPIPTPDVIKTRNPPIKVGFLLMMVECGSYHHSLQGRAPELGTDSIIESWILSMNPVSGGRATLLSSLCVS